MSFCPKCGKEIPDHSAFCPSCGQVIDAAQINKTTSNVPDYGQSGAPHAQSYGQSDYTYGYNQPSYGQGEGTNPMALAGFIVSMCSLVINLFGITALVGLILSIAGYNQIKQGRGRGKGFAIAGIVVGIIDIALAIIAILFLASLPSLLMSL